MVLGCYEAPAITSDPRGIGCEHDRDGMVRIVAFLNKIDVLAENGTRVRSCTFRQPPDMFPMPQCAECQSSIFRQGIG
jgi:hypothetical protein